MRVETWELAEEETVSQLVGFRCCGGIADEEGERERPIEQVAKG